MTLKHLFLFQHQKPPFAAEDDPSDVKGFLGLMFQAPKMFEGPSSHGVTVDDYLTDVEALVSKSEKDMGLLDDFCHR